MRGRTILGVIAAVVVACTNADNDRNDTSADCDGAKCDSAADGDAQQYLVGLAGEFEFCLAPALLDDEARAQIDDAFAQMPLPNLQSLRFMAHAADVAYWEPAEIGPELERLGFGKRGDGERMAACAADAEILRDSQSPDPFDDAGLSSCARQWHAAGGKTAAQFIRFAEHEVHPDRDLEFFTAGHEDEVDGEFIRGSTQLVWAQHRTEPWVVVAFRGTEITDTGDVWADANFPTVPADGGRVHGGFKGALETVSELLDERVGALEPDVRVWVTGHSLGGALASLYAAELLVRVDQGEGVRFAGLVTYGSPRVGDDDFFAYAEGLAIEHGAPLHRVSNVSNRIVGYDPITHVPFRSTFGQDFGHVGAPIELFDNGAMTYGLSTSRFLPPFGLIEDAIAAFKDKVVEGLSAAFPHFLSHYQDRIDKAIASPHHAELRRCGSRL